MRLFSKTLLLNKSNWEQPTQNPNLGSHSWNAIAYGNGLFVALGDEAYISTSADGETWTTATQNTDLYNTGTSGWRCLIYDGTQFVAFYLGGICKTSTDGTTWTYRGSITSGDYGDWFGFTYGNGKYVASSGFAYISTSTNLISWTTPTNLIYGPTIDGFYNLSYGANKFIGIMGNIGAGRVYTSTDGTTWTYTNNNLGAYTWGDIAYDGSRFIAIGRNGYISTSANGVNWTKPTQNSILGANNWTAITYGNGKLVAIGDTGYVSIKKD